MELKTANIDNVVLALETGDDELLANSICNSLEEPAIKMLPEVAHVKQLLLDEGLKIVSMSGSGSCVFAMSQNKKQLAKIAAKLEDLYFVELTKVMK